MKKTKNFEMTSIENGRILSDQEKMTIKGGCFLVLRCTGFIAPGPDDWMFGVAGGCVCDKNF